MMHSHTPRWTDPEAMATGATPLSSQLSNARTSLLYGMRYYQSGLCYNNWGGSSSGYATDEWYMYPILPANTRLDGGTTDRAVISVQCNRNISGTPTMAWDSSTIKTWTAATPYADASIYPQIYSGPSTVQAVSYDTSSPTSGFVAPELVLTKMNHCPAVSVWTYPDDVLSDEQSGYMAPGNFATGLPLRGYDRTAETQRYSVDSLVQNQTIRTGEDRETLISRTRRCVFGNGWANGLWITGTGSGSWIPINNASKNNGKVRTNHRALASRSTYVLTPCVVAAADASSYIRFASSGGGDTTTINVSSAATPTLFVGAPIEVSVDDYLVIEASSLSGNHIHIATLALFDAPDGYYI